MQLLCARMPYAIRMFERMLYPALHWTKHGTINYGCTPALTI